MPFSLKLASDENNILRIFKTYDTGKFNPGKTGLNSRAADLSPLMKSLRNTIERQGQRNKRLSRHPCEECHSLP